MSATPVLCPIHRADASTCECARAKRPPPSDLEQRLTLSKRAAKLDIKVHTSHVYPPIPIRGYDWSAVTDDYDVDFDSERGYFTNHPHGHGATELEAFADLLDQIEDERDGTIGVQTPHILEGA